MLGRLLKWRRSKTEKSFLPGQLRANFDPADLVASDHILADLPCTRYWGIERRAELDGLPPPGIPWWLARFDWVVGFQHGWADTGRFPRSVFCNPDYLDELSDFFSSSQLQRPKSRSILVVGGDDKLLSSQADSTLQALQSHFDDIYYEAKDCEHPFVKIMPIGLQEFYLRGHENEFHQAMNAPVNKTNWVIAAWGKWWPQLDRQLPDRASARAFCEEASFIETGMFEPVAYYEGLARSHFMICPLGAGIQAPKLIEALLMSAIPIMTSSAASQELKALGIPILIVSDWSDLSQELLAEQQKSLSIQVAEFRQTIMSLDNWWEFSFRRPPVAPHKG